jgi:hypothetical protein
MACRAVGIRGFCPASAILLGNTTAAGGNWAGSFPREYEEVVVDRLFAGNVQLISALQPLVEAAETTLGLSEAKRARTMIRVDAGAGTLDDLNWLLARGYEVVAKEYSGRRVVRLAKTAPSLDAGPDLLVGGLAGAYGAGAPQIASH